MSYRLQNIRKWCDMGHHQFLRTDHRFHRDKRSFDENEEHKATLKQLSGKDVLHQLDGMEHIILRKASKIKMLAKRKRECDDPYHCTRPDPEAEPGPRDTVLTFFFFFESFRIIQIQLLFQTHFKYSMKKYICKYHFNI